MDYVKWQYKVDLVSSMNQFLFSSWKKKSNPIRLQWLWSMTGIINLWSMSFFKEVKRSTEVLLYLFEMLLYFCIKITCASTIPFRFLDTERRATDVLIWSLPDFPSVLQVCWGLIYRKWRLEWLKKKVSEFINILKERNILCLNAVMVDISHLLGVKWL